MKRVFTQMPTVAYHPAFYHVRQLCLPSCCSIASACANATPFSASDTLHGQRAC